MGVWLEGGITKCHVQLLAAIPTLGAVILAAFTFPCNSDGVSALFSIDGPEMCRGH